MQIKGERACNLRYEIKYFLVLHPRKGYYNLVRGVSLVQDTLALSKF